jgi:hypothetical protein
LEENDAVSSPLPSQITTLKSNKQQVSLNNQDSTAQQELSEHEDLPALVTFDSSSPTTITSSQQSTSSFSPSQTTTPKMTQDPNMIIESPTSVKEPNLSTGNTSSALQESSSSETFGAGPTNSNRGEPSACIFVASLNAQKTDEQLKESVSSAFTTFGSILDLKVMRDNQGRPYAFVQYEHEEAIMVGHNQLLDGRPVRVEQARVNRTLFVNKYGRDLTELVSVPFDIIYFA